VRLGVGRRKRRSRAGDGAMLAQTTGSRRAAAVTQASKRGGVRLFGRITKASRGFISLRFFILSVALNIVTFSLKYV
jgi:hypothetical protein